MTEVAIIGGGVVGLACAAAAARRGFSVTVLEQNRRCGQEVSARNSGVIHAGMYYPPGSLKASTCVAGRARLYERCARLGIPHRRTGKLIVAAREEEVAALERLRDRGLENGAGDLELLDAAETRRREPRVRAVASLWSPETGIIDAHELMASFQAEAERHDAVVALRTRVEALDRVGDLWRIATVSEQGERFAWEVPLVVNAAGLGSEAVARMAGIDTVASGEQLHPCKGDYFTVAASLGELTRHLVYPLPVAAGLGIHVTFDLGGRFRLGPDTEYVEAPRYDIDPAKAVGFAAAVSTYLPEVRPEHLSPDYAGVRPKLQAPGEQFRDFVVREESSRGAPGLIDLLGIESPGLTAAAELGERVAAILGETAS